VVRESNKDDNFWLYFSHEKHTKANQFETLS
jgi:hypothetical protein